VQKFAYQGICSLIPGYLCQGISFNSSGQRRPASRPLKHWIPACAGMTMSELIRGSLEICGRGLLLQAGRVLEHNQARCAYNIV
jgi:hypothetical protein